MLASRPIALNHFKTLVGQSINPGSLEKQPSTAGPGKCKVNLGYGVMPKNVDVLKKMMGMSKGHKRTFPSRKME